MKLNIFQSQLVLECSTQNPLIQAPWYLSSDKWEYANNFLMNIHCINFQGQLLEQFKISVILLIIYFYIKNLNNTHTVQCTRPSVLGPVY